MNSANEWRMVKLEDICAIEVGKTPARKNPLYWGPGHPWLSIRDMNQGAEIYYTRETITDAAVDEANMKLRPAGSVLFSFKLSIGKVAIAKIPLFTNEAIAALTPIDEGIIDRSYLAHFLRAVGPGLQGNRAVMGATLNKRSLGEIDIPLPPLAEQQRIAGVLNQTTSILELARQEVREIDESRSALFESLFPASNYPVSTIGNFFSETQYGSSKKSGEAGKYPMLRMGNLSSTGNISYSDLKYLDLEEKEINKYTLRNRDILFNRTNSKELVGKTAVYYGEGDQVAYAGYLIRCRTNDLATPEFISGFLNSRIGKAQLFQRAKAIVGMANINAKELRTLRIPSVPVAEQEKYTSASRQLEDLRLAVEKKIEKLEELQKSLSTRAFAGQL